MGIVKNNNLVNPIIFGRKVAGIIKNSHIIYKSMNTFASAIFKNSVFHEGTPDFSQIATTDEGLWAMEDDYGTSYYFRGAVENNYVKFGGFYWRIIRINGDGSIRMIYDGGQAYANGISNSNRFVLRGIEYNFSNKNGINAHYWTSSLGNSTAKKELDLWYQTNIANKNLGQYVSDAIFINDCSVFRGVGDSSVDVDYGALDRLAIRNPSEPQFTKLQKSDAFTVDDTIYGNGDLAYPIGLITADEVIAAGGSVHRGNGNIINNSFYLYKSSDYCCWTMTPIRKNNNETDGIVNMYIIDNYGRCESYNLHNAIRGALAPVLNLKADVNVTGTGTMTDPYKIAGVD